MNLRNYAYLALFFSLNALSQNTSYQVQRDDFLFLTNEVPNKKEEIKGSPYLLNEFVPSEIPGYKGVTPPIRYNAALDEMEFMRDGKKYHVVKDDSLEIKLINKTYKYLDYQGKKGNEKGYMVVLYATDKDKFSLYKKERIVLMPEVIPNSSYSEPKPAYYKIEDEKFYISYDSKIVFMPKNKKELMKLVPTHTAEIEVYLKENKVSFDNEYNLIQLVKYLNTLK